MGDDGGRAPRGRTLGAWVEDPPLPGRRRRLGGPDWSAAGPRADGEHRAGVAEERVRRTIVAVTRSRGGCSGRRGRRARRQRGGSRRGASQGGAGALAPGRPADRARRASRRAPHLAERADRADAPVRRGARAAGGAESDRAPPRRVGHRRGAGGFHQRPAAVAALARGGAAVARALRALVPISVRDASDRSMLGNRLSFLFVDLPVGEPGCGGAAAEDRCGYPSAENPVARRRPCRR